MSFLQLLIRYIKKDGTMKMFVLGLVENKFIKPTDFIDSSYLMAWLFLII